MLRHPYYLAATVLALACVAVGIVTWRATAMDSAPFLITDLKASQLESYVGQPLIVDGRIVNKSQREVVITSIDAVCGMGVAGLSEGTRIGPGRSAPLQLHFDTSRQGEFVYSGMITFLDSAGNPSGVTFEQQIRVVQAYHLSKDTFIWQFDSTASSLSAAVFVFDDARRTPVALPRMRFSGDGSAQISLRKHLSAAEQGRWQQWLMENHKDAANESIRLRGVLEIMWSPEVKLSHPRGRIVLQPPATEAPGASARTIWLRATRADSDLVLSPNPMTITTPDSADVRRLIHVWSNDGHISGMKLLSAPMGVDVADTVVHSEFDRCIELAISGTCEPGKHELVFLINESHVVTAQLAIYRENSK